jgi:DNA-directed RNA polymerase II subunit RPB2
MERDAIVAHGMAKLLKEKTMDTSDAYSTYICGQCGLFATRMANKRTTSYASANDIYTCPACNNNNDISKIMIPYAAKLLFQELMAMNIAPRIRVKKGMFN